MGCTGSSEQVPKPSLLSSLSRHEWLSWQKSFRAYMDHKGIPHFKRGDKFIKYIGFLGDGIKTKLYFASTAHETRYDVLMFKFDVYFLFSTNGPLTKADNQSLKDYVSMLKNVAENMSYGKIDEAVKEKLLQDFNINNLFNRLKRLDMDSRISNYENLAIHELLFLWEECDNLESIQANNACENCSLRHPFNKCPAAGKTCWKCGKVNHFARCCRQNFTKKCTFCGSSHEIKKCPAFTKECSKCERLNHFSWMCTTEMIMNCIYCGGTHRSGRNYCSAGRSTCMICSKKGHYTSHCFHKKQR